MLLFIKGCGHHGDRISRFNTSHVTLYRQGEKRTRPGLPFQYISCYSLSYWLREVLLSELVSIHLMLLFINIPLAVWLWPDTFQYISCYSLSEGESLIQIGAVKFQYISCYSLSIIGKLNGYYYPMFQYISCYSLSTFLRCLCSSNLVSIHLMLLFIQWKRENTSKDGSFNTSHVTLYRGAGLVGTDPMAFQYISCYSLSLFRLWFLFAKSSFNTSHVTLYQGHNLNLHE